MIHTYIQLNSKILDTYKHWKTEKYKSSVDATLAILWLAGLEVCSAATLLLLKPLNDKIN